MSTAFDETIERSADPIAVRRAVDSLDGDRLRSSPELAGVVAAVVAASRFLTRLLLADPAALDVLGDLAARPAGLTADSVDELARWKRLELLRIAGRDLVGLDP